MKKILIIEDNMIITRLLKLFLTMTPAFDIDFVMTLEEAKNKINREKFDIYLVDLNLPDSSGIDTLNELKKIIGNSPYLVITGYPENLPAGDYLVKGEFTKKMLLEEMCKRLED